MEITFEKEYLSELYYKGECVDKKRRFQPPVVKKYVKTINIVLSSPQNKLFPKLL
jgi:toxin HigB-1